MKNCKNEQEEMKWYYWRKERGKEGKIKGVRVACNKELPILLSWIMAVKKLWKYSEILSFTNSQISKNIRQTYFIFKITKIRSSFSWHLI